METMHLIPNTEAMVPDLPSDEEILALFAEAGLRVDIVATCGDASCPECFRPAPARAA
jgi:hypothetical protein